MTEKVRDLSWRVSSSRALSCSRYWHRETAAIVFARVFYWKWRRMGLMEGRERSGGGGKMPAFCTSAVTCIGLILIDAPLPAFAVERAAVQKAVIWFDRRMGPVIGTDKRVAKADFRYFDDKHNYDCWDTTRNTTSLLLVLQEWGLLKYHVFGDRHYRGNALVLQTPHNTAVLVERATKAEWVVDMWPRGYLQPPDVMTVEQWVTED